MEVCRSVWIAIFSFPLDRVPHRGDQNDSQPIISPDESAAEEEDHQYEAIKGKIFTIHFILVSYKLDQLQLAFKASQKLTRVWCVHCTHSVSKLICVPHRQRVCGGRHNAFDAFAGDDVKARTRTSRG